MAQASRDKTAFISIPRDEAEDRIDRSSFVPAYYQLAQILERKIKQGVWQPGSVLASESELAQHYGLSRMTVRRALDKLVELGLVYAEKGRGTFVASPQVEKATFQFLGFHEDMQRRGLAPDARLLEAKVVAAPPRAARGLEVPVGSKVLFYRRVLLANGEPLVYDRKYLRYAKGKPILENDLAYLPLPEAVAQHSDVAPVSSRLSIQATVVREEEASLLQVPAGTPAFYIEQVICAADGRPVGYGWYIYRGDKYQFTSLARPL